MIKLEDLKPGIRVQGIEPGQSVVLRDVERYPDAANVIYRRLDGTLGERLLYRENEFELRIAQGERLWKFDADPELFRLVSEAYRIRLAHLFDPQLAVHTSNIEPLPHQITAVYEEMLQHKRLRFLLADDPGAGKTVMAGLLIRELMARGDLRRCLICVPGKLSEQWREELLTKFQLDFEIFSREMSRRGNAFTNLDRVIVSVDRAKKEDIKAQLRQSQWDLIVCDEAHQMSASSFGNRLEKTQRYRLGELLGELTHHFLLMTATPHNGKDEDFRWFLKLLDEQQFNESSVPIVDIAGSMRRMVKEDLRKFDGKPLFPERKAYTIDYSLSSDEGALYEDVTDYIRNEFQRADQLESSAKRNVGFALTILQRRLASSPKAIYQSLKRRRKRLQEQLHDGLISHGIRRKLLAEGYNEEDVEDLKEIAREEVEIEFISRSTAAGSAEELEDEVSILQRLEQRAHWLYQFGNDRKWEELCKLFDVPEMKTVSGRQRKLIIFTEYRDTLQYLLERLNGLRSPHEILAIDGSMPLHKRREVEYRFRNDPYALILVATDAAGEGINLQAAHLMVNYDLPWNPNRLEQRFGRIHRIGQREVCHLWNLVAGETREGMVYKRLLEKLQNQSNALDGQVFDVLGNSFQEVSLQSLLVEAIRYGDNPKVKARLEEAIDNTTEKEHVLELLKRQALVTDSIDYGKIMQLRDDMERASAGRLQPFYVRAFFWQAFKRFGGKLRELHREQGRFAIDGVPAALRQFAKAEGLETVKNSYKRICFDKDVIRLSDGLEADFIRPGHPLLDATINMMLSDADHVFRQGAILIDESDSCSESRVLFYLEHTIKDAVSSREAQQRTISQEVHFVEVNRAGDTRDAGSAPFLDYRPAHLGADEHAQLMLKHGWLRTDQLEALAIKYAINYLVPPHMDKVYDRRIKVIDKTEAAVRELQQELKAQEYRLQQQQAELDEWDNQLGERREQFEYFDWFDQLREHERFEQLERLGLNKLIDQAEQLDRLTQFEQRESQEQRLAGLREQQRWIKEYEQLEHHKQYVRKQTALLEDRQVGLINHRKNLARERQIRAVQPVIVGAALIVPSSLLLDVNATSSVSNEDQQVKEIAVRAVMDTESGLGNKPVDVRKQNRGYDLESYDSEGNLRFVVVKERRVNSDSVALSYNESITALNCADQHILALVQVSGTKATQIRYVKGFPYREPAPLEYSVEIGFRELSTYDQAPL